MSRVLVAHDYEMIPFLCANELFDRWKTQYPQPFIRNQPTLNKALPCFFQPKYVHDNTGDRQMPYSGKCCEWDRTMRQPIISHTHDMCGSKQLTNCLI